ncbi:small archaeal modifier protein 2 [Halobacteriales archaeon QS_4_66_20]|jgi:sulfur carrier protein|nr:MAG: small archaeal modifier protein 2 [Halobacteriales archaeon QS_4_66_20]PSQ35146.1 MAG: small archaeal modifier protein 2 [Halobacteriales archaeon SW_10_66_29]
MAITVELVGEGTREVDPDGDSYADLLAPFDVSRHEVSILVDGTPVPEDQPVDAGVDRVRVVRLIKGG